MSLSPHPSSSLVPCVIWESTSFVNFSSSSGYQAKFLSLASPGQPKTGEGEIFSLRNKKTSVQSAKLALFVYFFFNGHVNKHCFNPTYLINSEKLPTTLIKLCFNISPVHSPEGTPCCTFYVSRWEIDFVFN